MHTHQTCINKRLSMLLGKQSRGMAQQSLSFNHQARNAVDAVTCHHGKLPRTDQDSVDYNNCDQSLKQSEGLMNAPSYTNLQSFRLLKPSKFRVNPSIGLQVDFGSFLQPMTITRAGYTTKKDFNEFLSCFGVLAPEILSENNHEQIACLKILDKLHLTNYQISDTKVFLKATHMAELVQKKKVLERAARTMQRSMHASVTRKEFLLLRKKAIDIQSLCRGMLACKIYETLMSKMAAKVPQSLEVEFKLRKESEAASRIQEEEEWLNQCISRNVGFSSGRPVAACILHKLLLQWRFSEIQKTRIFDRIMENMATFIEKHSSNEKLAYWLSNSSVLFVLLQRKSTNGVGNSTSERRRLRLVQLFKQKLRTSLEKIYGVIRENIKNEISPILALCIQIPRKPYATMSRGKSRGRNHAAHDTDMVHWQNIIKILTNHFIILKANHVPSLLVQKVFTQVFFFINVQLFNSLLLRRECCSFSNGRYVKFGLSKLESWCFCTEKELLGSAWDELKHIRQAAEFLVTEGKSEMTLEEVTECLCPKLSVSQVHRVTTMFWDDRHGTKNVSSEVMEMLRLKTRGGSSFLLDEDSSIPFSADEMCGSVAVVPFETSDIHLPPPLPAVQNKHRYSLSSIEERISNLASLFDSA